MLSSGKHDRFLVVWIHTNTNLRQIIKIIITIHIPKKQCSCLTLPFILQNHNCDGGIRHHWTHNFIFISHSLTRTTYLCAQTSLSEDLVDEQPWQLIANGEEDLAKRRAKVDVWGQHPGQERGVAVGGPVVRGSSLSNMKVHIKLACHEQHLALRFQWGAGTSELWLSCHCDIDRPVYLDKKPRSIREHMVVDVSVFHRHGPILVVSVNNQSEPNREGHAEDMSRLDCGCCSLHPRPNGKNNNSGEPHFKLAADVCHVILLLSILDFISKEITLV